MGDTKGNRSLITIVNYGLGNVSAFANVYKRANIAAQIASSAAELADTTHLILPGVGSFDRAVALLDASGMRDTLERLVLKNGVPVLGVCVGMQLLADGSDEGHATGLGWIGGRVRGFASEPRSARLPQPHMGWNDVTPKSGGALFQGLETDARFYFLHSYYFDCDKPAEGVATAGYGFDFDCAIAKRNIYGVQFHPEKSHHWGSTLLKNFAEI